MGDQTEVLIVDDEAIVGERLRDYQEKRGLAVETFTASTEALARLEEKTFDVVVTDIKMEGPTGIDVLLAVKRAAAGSEVIMITGYADFETLRESEAIGAMAYIPKPFKIEDVYKQVEKAAAKAKKNRR